MMFRRYGWLYGSFILNQRLVVDWGQPFYREDVHTKARARLQELQASDWYKVYILGKSEVGPSGGVSSPLPNSSSSSTPSSSQSSPMMLEVHEEEEEEASAPSSLPPHPSSSAPFTANVMEEEEEDQGMMMVDASSSSLPSEEESEDHKVSEEEEEAEALPPPRRPPPPLNLFESNALVTTFTNQRNMEDLTILLAFIRQGLDHVLSAFHYHAVLRVLAYRQEKEEAVQLLEVMSSQRREQQQDEEEEEVDVGDGEADEDADNEGQGGAREETTMAVTSSSSSASPARVLTTASFTLETYARVMDAVHCLAPEDVLQRLLVIIALAQDRFIVEVPNARPVSAASSPRSHIRRRSGAKVEDGERRRTREEVSSSPENEQEEVSKRLRVGFLWWEEARGSEGCTIAGLSPWSEEGRRAMENPAVMAGPRLPPSSFSASPSCSSPPLSSLLHHVTHRGSESPRTICVASLVVVFWMLALRVPLGDWDYFHILTNLVCRREAYAWVQWCLGSLSSEDGEDGEVAPPAVEGNHHPDTAAAGSSQDDLLLHSQEKREENTVDKKEYRCTTSSSHHCGHPHDPSGESPLPSSGRWKKRSFSSYAVMRRREGWLAPSAFLKGLRHKRAILEHMAWSWPFSSSSTSTTTTMWTGSAGSYAAAPWGRGDGRHVSRDSSHHRASRSMEDEEEMAYEMDDDDVVRVEQEDEEEDSMVKRNNRRRMKRHPPPPHHNRGSSPYDYYDYYDYYPHPNANTGGRKRTPPGSPYSPSSSRRPHFPSSRELPGGARHHHHAAEAAAAGGGGGVHPSPSFFSSLLQEWDALITPLLEAMSVSLTRANISLEEPVDGFPFIQFGALSWERHLHLVLEHAEGGGVRHSSPSSSSSSSSCCSSVVRRHMEGEKVEKEEGDDNEGGNGCPSSCTIPLRRAPFYRHHGASPLEEGNACSQRIRGGGLGPHQYNGASLYHALTLLFSTCRCDTLGLDMLSHAKAKHELKKANSTSRNHNHTHNRKDNHNERRRRKTGEVKEVAEEGEEEHREGRILFGGGGCPTTTTTTTGAAGAESKELLRNSIAKDSLEGNSASRPQHEQEQDGREEEGEFELSSSFCGGGDGDNALVPAGKGEPFRISLHHLLDAGPLFAHVSCRTVQSVREVFSSLLDQLSSEAQLQRQQWTLLEMNHRVTTLTVDGGAFMMEGQDRAAASTSPWEISFADATATSPPPLLCTTTSLAVPVPLPSTEDVVSAQSFLTSMLSSVTEARAALDHLISITKSTYSHQPRTIRLLYKQLAEYCSRHPPSNPKFTPTGLAERRKWGVYLDARDVALTLLGSAHQARECMKYVYYHSNTLQGLRSLEVIRSDMEDMVEFFATSSTYVLSTAFPAAAPVVGSPLHVMREMGDANLLPYLKSLHKHLLRHSSSSPPSSQKQEEEMEGEEKSEEKMKTAAEQQQKKQEREREKEREEALAALQIFTPGRRTTLPFLRCPKDPVPRFLFDPAVYNPYPHIALRIPIEMLPSRRKAKSTDFTCNPTSLSSSSGDHNNEKRKGANTAASVGGEEKGKNTGVEEEEGEAGGSYADTEGRNRRRTGGEEARTQDEKKHPSCYAKANNAGKEGCWVEQNTEEEEDLFPALWNTIMNTDVMGRDVWYLRNTDMYLLLLQCLLHRLDWEAAADLTIRMLEHSKFTHKMDHVMTRIFKEIGDSAGCLAFKVATRLFDGRIVHEGQVKRTEFHERQRRGSSASSSHSSF